MRLQAAVQALKKAEPLKNKIQHCKDLLNDNDAWVCQQQLQKIYQRVLILDLEYALDEKVEQELWNFGFKNYIDVLQYQAKDRLNLKRSESQIMLNWCLETASGFYLTLLQEICTAFDLDLPFRRNSYVYGCILPWKAIEKVSKPHNSSCFYVCQYCLVHLGDIARYKNEYKQAELFYRNAVSLSPSSGQPYNQLALLEASRGNKLGTVFHYVRSVAVKHPFPVASTNLAKTLFAVLNDSINISTNTKLTCHEYVAVFLKFHGIIHHLGDLNQAKDYIKLLTETLTNLVETESFSSWRLIQMLIINIYAIYHLTEKPLESSMDLLKIAQLSLEKKLARNCILNVIAGSLSALLLPVSTIKNSCVDYLALPAIKLCFDWICLQPEILNENPFSSRLQIWPNFCVLLNILQGYIGDFKFEQFKKIPLPEDRILRGFLPIEKIFETLRFSNDSEGDPEIINKLRAVRLLNHGRYLAQHKINGTTLINVNYTDEKSIKFTSFSKINVESNDDLKNEFEKLTLSKNQKINCGTNFELVASNKFTTPEITKQCLFDKKIGILKPQSLLECSKESPNINCYSQFKNDVRQSSDISSLSLPRKTRQNIAMQAIIRRAETEHKQVTFKNISPIYSEETKANTSDTVIKMHNQVPMTLLQSDKTNEILQNQRSQGPILTPLILPITPTHQDVFENLNASCQTQQKEVLNEVNNQAIIENFEKNISSYVDYNPHSLYADDILHNSQLNKKLIGNSMPCASNFATQDFNIHPTNNLQIKNQPYSPINSSILNLEMRSKHENNQIELGSNQLNDIPSISTNYLISSQFCELPTSSSSSLSSLSSSSSSSSRSSSCTYQQSKNSPIIQNNETSDFNVWKDTQPPQPPLRWSNSKKFSTEVLISTNTENLQRSLIVEGSSVFHEDNFHKKSFIDHSFNQFEAKDNCKSISCNEIQYSNVSNNIENTYSLFSENSWQNSIQNSITFGQEQSKAKLNQQSLWSGPGPSPLERLLEQQKSLREGGT